MFQPQVSIHLCVLASLGALVITGPIVFGPAAIASGLDAYGEHMHGDFRSEAGGRLSAIYRGF
jgi:hypothetical protein